MYTLDFETEAIDFKSPRPPKPVGLAVKHDDKLSHYYAWGHPTKNNSTLGEATEILKAICLSHEPCVFHNAKFDINVMKYHLDMKPYGWIDDTMFMAFIDNPHSKSLALKALSVVYLGRNPDEQDKLRYWILKNVRKATEKNWGGFICEAPGDLTGEYARSDVDMTYGLAMIFIPRMESDNETVIKASVQ